MRNFENLALINLAAILAFFSISALFINITRTFSPDYLYKNLQIRVALFQVTTIIMIILEVAILSFDFLDFLFYFTEFFKALLVIFFMEIVLKTAGFENIEGTRFSQAKVESVLIRQGTRSLANKEEVNWFLLKTRIFIIQYCIISFSELVLSTFLKFYINDYLKFGTISFSSGFLWLLFLKSFSFGLVFFQLRAFCRCFGQDFLIKDFKRKSNFFLMFLFVSEVQVIGLSLLFNFTNIYKVNEENESVGLINLFYLYDVVVLVVKVPEMFRCSFGQEVQVKDTTSNILELTSAR